MTPRPILSLLAGAHIAASAILVQYGGPNYDPNYRRMPRFERPYEYDRPYRQFEDRDWISPRQRQFEQDMRQYDRMERRNSWGPWRPY
jgi:hypothetical protein